MSENTLADYVRALHNVKQQRADLSARDKELKEAEEGFEILILQAMPEGSDKITFTVDDAGTQRSVIRGTKTRFSTVEGNADAFFNWVKSTGNIHFMNRTVKQAEIESFQAEFRALPPGIAEYRETTLKSTTTRKPPTI
jgi:hypothetical protein